MARPRHHLLPENTTLHVHCVQRCVRRAFLCGKDALTGRSFDHRKDWIEARIGLLANCFAVAVHAYAVMSNHVHLVLSIKPQVCAQWSDAEVAQRWCQLFPSTDDTPQAAERKRQALLADPERIAVLRQRLGSLSWLMKCLAEPIARRANAEDGCSGRFWEGRFKAQRLCDDKALLAAMAYVDLNPVRAGVADTLADCAHTSVARRLAMAEEEQTRQPLRPLLGISAATPPLSLGDYLRLVDWTGRQQAPGKRCTPAGSAPSAVGRIDRSPSRWLSRVNGVESRYWRAIGDADDLLALARQLGQRWLKGIGQARVLRVA